MAKLDPVLISAGIKYAQSAIISSASLLHVSLNRGRFKHKNMQQFKVLQHPLRV
ncbi:hypothetical protein [Sinorhizobium terangae]|uniref:hypothetical protein n=1 Tax=Sinorhizobium terangae TaxID=110322 RepID=UPI0024B25646|nr:hypothetical protein [Sinorhizobium terangae]WFU50995.1 hypothetical protein QA637_20510 [Sinorhizobium terangae]